MTKLATSRVRVALIWVQTQQQTTLASKELIKVHAQLSSGPNVSFLVYFMCISNGASCQTENAQACLRLSI